MVTIETKKKIITEEIDALDALIYQWGVKYRVASKVKDGTQKKQYGDTLEKLTNIQDLYKKELRDLELQEQNTAAGTMRG